jgi:CheY-like chemotaxis protein
MRPGAKVMTNARILIVEDEHIVAWDLERRLTRLGYAVLGIVSSGQDAIEQALEFRPDLILMDIRLPGNMDGIEAAERIRAQLETVVVYMTAYADERTVQRALASNPAAVMRKPFHSGELQRTLESALGHA